MTEEEIAELIYDSITSEDAYMDPHGESEYLAKKIMELINQTHVRKDKEV